MDVKSAFYLGCQVHPENHAREYKVMMLSLSLTYAKLVHAKVTDPLPHARARARAHTHNSDVIQLRSLRSDVKTRQNCYAKGKFSNVFPSKFITVLVSTIFQLYDLQCGKTAESCLLVI
jgi:hypothetical protein